jgi:CcmD family protein
MKNNWLNRLPRRAALLLAAVLLPLLPALAQQPAATGPEMADQLRQDGKIYVVVAVIVVILVGLLLYLISIDRKVTRLERELRD